ncbi:hypothetical protein [Streptomyces antarcticus]|uniref:hypothetical protein n=1 Tax=Streptomyces antarcticus TaxID=2996458 RepID=UPI0022AEEB8C|nr:hypothetical protein [Streptomyces sp. H34-S5]MCZ4087307.1 hypothetical protein [Streptomyces sp. H34-S5]
MRRVRVIAGEAESAAPALACLLYFAGTVPYVKTMIRERNSRAYRRGSAAYHAVALAVAACLSPWLALPFAAYLARAAALPGRGLRVPVVGAIELACSAASSWPCPSPSDPRATPRGSAPTPAPQTPAGLDVASAAAKARAGGANFSPADG